MRSRYVVVEVHCDKPGCTEEADETFTSNESSPTNRLWSKLYAQGWRRTWYVPYGRMADFCPTHSRERTEDEETSI